MNRRARLIRAGALNVIERGSSEVLGRWILATHQRAFVRVLSRHPELHPLRRVAVIGGGLFPRTAIVLRRLLPEVGLTLIDARAEHLAIAQRHLQRLGIGARGIEWRQGFYPDQTGTLADFDLVVMPLALVGDRRALYDADAGPPRLIHDWAWRRRGQSGTMVSLLMLKRLNLALPAAA
jgi:hypothetical protein